MEPRVILFDRFINLLLHSNFWIRNTYFLARVWIFLSSAREIEAKTTNIEEKQRTTQENTNGHEDNSIRNFEVEALISYSNNSYLIFLV